LFHQAGTTKKETRADGGQGDGNDNFVFLEMLDHEIGRKWFWERRE
jgi:hypothetical protein